LVGDLASLLRLKIGELHEFHHWGIQGHYRKTPMSDTNFLSMGYTRTSGRWDQYVRNHRD